MKPVSADLREPVLLSKLDLPKKPLIEAIAEVRWSLRENPSRNTRFDPNYKVLVGTLYAKVSSDYPEHTEKPEALLPDEMVPYITQHQFRVAPDDWPLIQLGPGILTINDTHKYTWTDFKERARKAIQSLFDVYPKSADFVVTSSKLWYIDAVEFDYTSENIFDFVREKMRVPISLPAHVLADIPVIPLPQHFSLTTTYRCEIPQGVFGMKFATGQKENAPVLICETWVESSDGRGVPNTPQDFDSWFDRAHVVTHNSFFRLIEGELERRFRDE